MLTGSSVTTGASSSNVSSVVHRPNMSCMKRPYFQWLRVTGWFFIDGLVFFLHHLLGKKKKVNGKCIVSTTHKWCGVSWGKEFHIARSHPRQNPKPLVLGFKKYSLLTKALCCNSAMSFLNVASEKKPFCCFTTHTHRRKRTYISAGIFIATSKLRREG